MDTFREMWLLVKHFLADFVKAAREGTKQHKKGMLVFCGLSFIGFMIIAVSAYKVSESPAFCGVCHRQMDAYVESWKTSTHHFVGCVDCHYKPGFLNHLKGKLTDGQVSLVYFITGKQPGKFHAQIDDASCTQCHEREELGNKLVFKNVVFSHSNHLEQLRRGKKLRCTTCHGEIVQGKHIVVSESDCFICHFYRGHEDKEIPKRMGSCVLCHVEPRGDIVLEDGVRINHKQYIDRGPVQVQYRCKTQIHPQGA